MSTPSANWTSSVSTGLPPPVFVSMITNTICLIVDWFLLVVCVLQILANLLVLVVWASKKKLRNNDNLILLVSLAFIDFVYAILQFPYLVILIIGWKPNGQSFNYNPWVIVRLVGPSAALMKSGCTVTTAIALDRILAFYFPIKYYQLSKRHWCTGAFFFAILMAFIDWVILQFTVTIVPKPECSSFGCFTNSLFRAYWGLSNMMMNLASCLLTILIIYHLKKRPAAVSELEKQYRSRIDKSANRVALYILLVSALIGVVPGCMNGVGTIVNIPLLDEVSFFVGTSATLSGLSHAFIFAMAHREIKRATLSMFGFKTASSHIATTSFFKTSQTQSSSVSVVSRPLSGRTYGIITMQKKIRN